VRRDASLATPPKQPELGKPEKSGKKKKPRRRKGLQGVLLLRVPSGAVGDPSHGSKYKIGNGFPRTKGPCPLHQRVS